MAASRYSRIYTLLQQYTPVFIDLVDESHKHRVPEGIESHFKLTLVSVLFKGKSRVERHRMINTLVQSERDAGLHALSLALFSPEEWEKMEFSSLVTPPCHHKT